MLSSNCLPLNTFYTIAKMQNVYICIYSTSISISIKTYLGPQTKMFALVLVLKKNGSTFRYLCFSGLFPTFKYILNFCFYRYFLASFYTKYDTTHFILNTASLLSVLIPKMPQLHGVRIFGINKYWNILKWNKKFYSYWVFCKEGVVSKLHNVKWEVATLESQLLVLPRLFWSTDSYRKMPLLNASCIFLKRGFMGRLGRPSL